MVRNIELTDITIGAWGAVEAMLEQQYYAGTFEDVVVLLDWPDKPRSMSLGVHEDGDMMNAAVARERGYIPGRRYSAGGSVGVYGSKIPGFVYYFDGSDHEVTLDALSREVGEAIASVVQEYGLDAEYDHIGDVKVRTDEGLFKVAANAPAELAPDLWAITVSVIWGYPPEGTQEILDASVRVPPEKFEDKDEKTVTGRMSPLSEKFEEFDVGVSKSEFLERAIDAATGVYRGRDERVEIDELTPDEERWLERLTPFFESDVWIDRVATSRMCQHWDDDAAVGVAAYKSRKLVKSSVIVEDGRLRDVLITGDYFIRPHPTVVDRGGPHRIETAVTGLPADDTDALQSAVESVYEADDFEVPMVDPDDFVVSIQHAAENTQPVASYLEEYN